MPFPRLTPRKDLKIFFLIFYQNILQREKKMEHPHFLCAKTLEVNSLLEVFP